MKDLAIIIVSFNVRQLLDECLASVYASRGVAFDVCVVDNASSDSSAQMVREGYPQARLIESPGNGGYAYANNLGIRAMRAVPGLGEDTAANGAGYRYVLLLNPDTRVGPDDFAQTIAFMDTHPAVGIVGPKLVRQDGKLDLACRRSFPTPEISLYRMLGLSRLFPLSHRLARYNLTYLDADQTAEVDAVAGAFMMVRQEAIQQTGLLDERFFMYGEDLDWALRIKSYGWKVVYYPKVTVLHYKGESSRRHRRRATIEFYRSMLLFYRKHYASSTPLLLDWLIVAAIYLRGTLAYAEALLKPPALGLLRSQRSASSHS